MTFKAATARITALKCIMGGLITWMGSLGAWAEPPERPENFYEVYDLSLDWQVYDARYEAHVPYVAVRHQNPKAMGFWLEAARYSNHSLVFPAYPGMYLFVNDRLAGEINQPGWQVLPIDSLRQHYPEDQLFISFFDPQQRLPFANLFVGGRVSFPKVKSETRQRAGFQEPLLRRSLDRKDFSTLVFMLLLTVFTFIYNFYHKNFFSFYSWQSSLSSLSRIDMNFINKPLNAVSLVFLGYHALSLTLVYRLAQFSWDSRSIYQWLPGEDLGAQLVNYLLFAVLIMALLLAKYLFNIFFGSLLTIERTVVYTHFFEYIRLSMLFYTPITVIMFGVFVHETHYFAAFMSYFKYFLLAFHVLQSFLVSFYVIKQVPHRSLYLFYYLCITELTPLLIGIKLLLY